MIMMFEKNVANESNEKSNQCRKLKKKYCANKMNLIECYIEGREKNVKKKNVHDEMNGKTLCRKLHLVFLKCFQ